MLSSNNRIKYYYIKSHVFTEFTETDIDENDDFVKEVGIRGVPITFVYKNGELVAKKN